MTETEAILFGVYNNLVKKHPDLKPSLDLTFSAAFNAVAARAQNQPVSEEAKLNTLWGQQDYILSNLPTVNKEFYDQNKKIIEIEHQVGRYLNMRAIAQEIAEDEIEGDIIEFGTWQGLGIIEPYLQSRKKPIFFMFDDWGCHPDEVPDAFFDWLFEASKKFNLKAQKISVTRLTRNYKITFGQS